MDGFHLHIQSAASTNVFDQSDFNSTDFGPRARLARDAGDWAGRDGRTGVATAQGEARRLTTDHHPAENARGLHAADRPAILDDQTTDYL